MKSYAQYLPYDGSLYRCILALTTNNNSNLKDNEIDYGFADSDSSLLIQQTRDLLDGDLTSMASQSYERSYQAIIDAQVLVELKEIIMYKKNPSKRDWLMDTWCKRLQGCERSLEYWHRLLLVRYIVLPKEKDIKSVAQIQWHDRRRNHQPVIQSIKGFLFCIKRCKPNSDGLCIQFYIICTKMLLLPTKIFIKKVFFNFSIFYFQFFQQFYHIYILVKYC